MKHINYFKHNVKPTSEHAERQWKWNYLRKLKKRLIAEGRSASRDDFVAAGSGIGLWPKSHPYKSKRGKAKSRKQMHYDQLKTERRTDKPNRGDQSGWAP